MHYATRKCAMQPEVHGRGEMLLLFPSLMNNNTFAHCGLKKLIPQKPWNGTKIKKLHNTFKCNRLQLSEFHIDLFVIKIINAFAIESKSGVLQKDHCHCGTKVFQMMQGLLFDPIARYIYILLSSFWQRAQTRKFINL